MSLKPVGGFNEPLFKPLVWPPSLFIVSQQRTGSDFELKHTLVMQACCCDDDMMTWW